MKKFITCLLGFYLLTMPIVGNAQFALSKSATIEHNDALSTNDRIFFTALAQRESDNNPRRINKFGYMGKYQFGEGALVALGYYKKDGSRKNDWKGSWTGKDGIHSKEDFLSNPTIQDKAVKKLSMLNWQMARNNKLHHYIGETINGVTVTKAGILAGMHLKGGKSVIDFINYSHNSHDAFGTGVKDYMDQFSVYSV